MTKTNEINLIIENISNKSLYTENYIKENQIITYPPTKLPAKDLDLNENIHNRLLISHNTMWILDWPN